MEILEGDEMSNKVKNFLRIMKIETTHEERIEIDKEIEKKTNKNCDIGIDELNNEELLGIINSIKNKKKKKKESGVEVVNTMVEVPA